MAIFKENMIYDTIKEPGFPFAHCSNITQIDNNTLIAQWYAGKGEQNKNQSIFASKYDIKNEKWSEPYLLSKSTEYPDGNGVLWKHEASEKLFFFYATMWTHSPFKKFLGRGWHYCKLFYRISTDNGDTWGPIITMKDKVGYMFRNKPICLENGKYKGRILVPMYEEEPSNGFMALSDDQGESFSYSDLILEDTEKHPKQGFWLFKSGVSQPTITELKNGNVIALLRTRLYKKIFKSISTNGGQTWDPAVAIDLPNPDSGIDMITLKSGKLLLIFNNAESGRHNMSLAISDDDSGTNWKVVKSLEDDSNLKFSYPAIIQTKDGMIHVTYTYNRKTIKHIYFDEDWLLR